MDRKLQLIAHLYGEPTDELEPLSSLLEDESLREEYAALQTARFQMDHRARVRPDARSIDAILSRALRPGHAGPRLDRSPVIRRPGLRRLLIPALAMAAVVVLSVAIRSWTSQSTVGPDVARRDAELGTAPPESLLRALPPTPSIASPSAATARWETGDDVRRLSRRLEALRAAGVDQWDEPAVPLELLSPASGSRQVVPAGNRP